MRRSAVDSEAFGTSVDDLYRLHAGAARQVALSITRNADDASDAVAEAFTGVLEALSTGRLSGTEAFRPYLLAATRNASIDIVRRTGRLRPTDEPEILDGTASSNGPSDRLVAGEDRAIVAEAYAELPPRWRAILWLTEVQGLAPREVAPLVDLTPNNVAQLAVRARARLRQRYVQLHVRNHAVGDCREPTELLGGLVAGGLTTAQTNRVRGHLAECRSCRDRLAELDDVGLFLRRAAVPVPLLLHRFRGRWWPWSSRVATLDPAAPTNVLALLTSPVVQQVAAVVSAGVLALGIGTAVRERGVPTTGTGGRPGAVAAAAPLAAAAPAPDLSAAPVPTTTTALSPTTTTAPPATSPTTVTTLTTVPPVTVTTVTTATTATTVVEGPAAPAATQPATFVPAGRLPSAHPSLVATAAVPAVAVYDRPGGVAARTVLANPRRSGAPLTLLVTVRQGDWLQVLLPVRPNGSTGWIRADQVTLATHDFKIVVELGAHRLTAYQGTEVLLSEPVALGTSAAPTPGGLFYITELVEPLDQAGRYNPGGPYGPYAYGLSGYSEVLFDFAGGDGQFGIHGTNDPSSLGRDVSHGCIRMSNAGITRLAGILPLGVPVEIRA